MNPRRKMNARPQSGRSAESSHSQRKSDRKLQQLCRQVERALAYVVPGGLADPVLQDLSIDSVTPAPDASRLLVQLRTAQPAADVPQILERLERVRGYFRREVAAAVTRKRVPELVFHLIPEREVDHE
jgi:ribosome-binding factor A